MDEPRLEVRVLTADDGAAAIAVINTAAEWYADFLPEADIHDPEMTLDSWIEEDRRLTWYGAFDRAGLVGVMGLEYVGDVALLRHAYVLPDRQRRRVGTTLQQHLEAQVEGVDTIIVGTYAANHKARAALEKAGYRASANAEAVLRRYYDIPEDRLRSSVTYERSVVAPRPPGDHWIPAT